MVATNDRVRYGAITHALIGHAGNYYLANGAISQDDHRRRRRRKPMGLVPPLPIIPYRSAIFAFIALCRIGSPSLLSVALCAFCPVSHLTASSQLQCRHRSFVGSFSSSSRHRDRPSTSMAFGMSADYDRDNMDIGKGGPSTASSTATKTASSTAAISNIVNSRSNDSNNKHINRNPTTINKTKELNKTETNGNIDNTNRIKKNNEFVKKNRRPPRPYSPSSSSFQSRRPYADLSVDELRQLTEYHLSRNIRPDGSLSLGTMTPGQRHEFARLISSWSKLSVVQTKSSMKNTNSAISTSTKQLNVTITDESPRSTGVVTSLTGEEKLLAAEMAEQCLRELIEEENASLTSSSSSTSTSSATTPPDLYYLVIKARLDVGKGGNGGSSGHGRKGNSSYRDLRHATSLLDLMERQQQKRWQHQSSLLQYQKQLEHAQNHKQREKPSTKLTSSPISSLLLSVMKCYTAVIDGWCKSKMTGSEIRAEELLRRMMNIMTMTIMEHGHDDGRDNIDEAVGVVLVRQYNNVMNRISMCGKPNAGAEAERLLYELIAASSLSSSSPSRSFDNTPSIAVTTATSAASTPRAPPSPQLLSLLAPDRISFNTAIKAHANAGGEHAVANAERILSVMENYRPPSASSSSKKTTNVIAPDKISYTSVLMAYASSSGKRKNIIDAGERAEELLGRITKLYEEGGNGGGGSSDVKPDTVMYNAVLKVW